MTYAALCQRISLLVMLALLGTACSAETLEPEVSVTKAALSACDETVPADRNIDGFPAYAQCDASENSAIYSNNGIDTSLTSQGPDWIRTQWSGGYQCTELAHRYLHFKWEVDWLPNGNAGFWCDDDPPGDSGIIETMEPVHGDIMVLSPGSCGASSSTGHVTVVDIVAGDRLTVVEQNGARRGTYEMSCATCFLHVVANTGEDSGEAGTSGTAGAAGEAGASGAAGAGTGGTAGNPEPDPMPVIPPEPTPDPTPVPDPMPVPAAPIMPPPVAGMSGGAMSPELAGASASPELQQRRNNAEAATCAVAQVGGSSASPWFFGLVLGLWLASQRRRRQPPRQESEPCRSRTLPPIRTA